MRTVMERKLVRSAFMVAAALLIVLCGAAASFAETPKDAFMWGYNYFANSYYKWSTPVMSYLVPVDGGYMRVQAGNVNNVDILDYEYVRVGVEYYDSSFNRIGKTYKLIGKELPIWGGFYAYGDFYYIITGQWNEKESDDVEVIRVTKYDKNWNRVGSASLYGDNTYSPFSFGSCDVTGWGHYLIIHTCHQMYKSSDGLNHQSNLSLYLDVDKMDTVKSFSLAYASHAFTQLIREDNGKLVTVDHGDSFPRGIRLNIYDDYDPYDPPEDYDKTKFYGEGYVKNIMILEAAQRKDYRETGLKAGDLQVSDTSYLVAGASVDQSSGTNSTYNVYVGAVDKNTEQLKLRWFTDYPEGGTRSVFNPYLVKISGKKFLLIWNEEGKYDSSTVKNTIMKCVYLNEAGEAVSEVYTMDGILSDCEPVISGGEIVWYAYDAPKVLFYHMPVTDPSKMTCVTRKWKKPSNLKLKKVTVKLKYKKLKKYTYTIWGAIDAQCDCPVKNLRYSAKGANKKSRKALKFIKKTGDIKVKKGTKKGTYKLKVTVSAVGTGTYLAEKKTTTITIKVK